MSSVKEVANNLVNFCRQGQFQDAIAELYHDDILSIEQSENYTETVGKQAVLAKAKKFDNDVEMIESYHCSDPVYSDKGFADSMLMHVKLKDNAEAIRMSELALYDVVDGKIIKEQFFY